MAVLTVLMLERLEKRPEATPAAFSPPTIVGTASVSVFHVSPPPHLGNTKEGLHIDVFRSS
jgi:hypothetical protein